MRCAKSRCGIGASHTRVREVDPGQKERIIQALRHTGHVVGFLGDGINDAPACISRCWHFSERAVDVAKEAADWCLVAHDMEVLRDRYRGRSPTFANTIKYLFITTSRQLSQHDHMALASLILPFLPLLAKAICFTISCRYPVRIHRRRRSIRFGCAKALPLEHH